MSRPTKRAFVFTFVGCLLVITGMTAQAGWLFVLAAAILGPVASSSMSRHRLSACDVARSTPARVPVGDDVIVRLTLTNTGRKPLPPARAEDRFPAFAEPAEVVSGQLSPGHTAETEITRRASRRGVFQQGRVEMTAGWPFGLSRSRRSLDVTSPMIVLPRFVELSVFPLLERSSVSAEELRDRATTGPGQDFIGVREYRPGDPMRFVHWRSTARAGRLVVREYEREAASRVAVIVAGDERGPRDDSDFEALVSAAASVAVYALATGRRVTLIGRSIEGRIERLVDGDRVAVLEWLARARPSGTRLVPLVEAAMSDVSQNQTVVVCAPSLGTAGDDLTGAVDAVETNGGSAVAVVARSSSWIDAESAREAAVLERLRNRGVALRVLERGQDLRRCLQG